MAGLLSYLNRGKAYLFSDWKEMNLATLKPKRVYALGHHTPTPRAENFHEYPVFKGAFPQALLVTGGHSISHCKLPESSLC